MRIRTAVWATPLALALSTLPAASQGFGPPGHGPGHGGMDPILHMAKELDLSDAQLAQVKTITAKHEEAFGQTMERTHEARAAVQRTIHDVTATEAQVREAAASVALLESQTAVEHHRMAIEISAVLTADQRAKLAELFANMKERHTGPPGGRGGF